MSEITKEYLDEKLAQLATKEDISRVDKKIDALSMSVDKKIDSLIDTVDNLARMVADGFEEIKNELDVRKEVTDLNHRMSRIEQALNLRN